MGDQGEDVRYIQDLINGIGPDSNAQGGRGARHPRRISTQATQNAQQRNAGHVPRNNRGSRNRHAPSPAPQAEDEEDKYNQPSDKSTTKVLHCFTCDVWVPSRQGDWQVHIAGIRHRRHVLSFREYGERGRLVLSAFESDPRPGESSHKIAGRASAAEFGLDQGASGSGSGSQKYQQGRKKNNARKDPADAEFDAMRTEAMKRCLGIYGSGLIYNATIDNYFSIERLGQDYPGRLRYAGHQNHLIIKEIAKIRGASSTPSNQLYMAHQLRNQAAEKQQEILTTPDVGGAARQDQKAPKEFLLPPVVILHMDYGGSDYIAAWLCSLQSFINALADNPDQVVRLIIETPTNFHAYLEDTFRKGWERVLIDMENVLLAKNAQLKEISFFLSASAIDNRGGALVKNLFWSTEGKLIDKAREMAANCRLAVLMSQHPRLGRCSLLQLLPSPVIQQIVEEAVPREGCVINMAAMTPVLPRQEFRYNPDQQWTVIPFNPV